MMDNWSPQDALSTYNIPYWGSGYFGINDAGNVTVMPKREQSAQQIDLSELAEQLGEFGLTRPVLVRFSDILHDRVHSLCGKFNEAIANYGYQGEYLAVYPIKVNQQRRVVEELIASQESLDRSQLGLEAGSKPELLAVLALAGKASSVIVCNGYKDREYIRLALLGEKLGHEVYIVLEKLSELDLVLAEARKLGVTPRLGIRARLASQGKGKWQSSGGEKSKFGLSANQILHVLDRLRQHHALACLQLIHFHLGSQLANIRDIQKGLKECARFYAELHQLGAPIRCVDVGGGLAVDYEGTRTQSSCSANYTLGEYANNVIWAMGDICEEYQLPHPRIISESGRAMTAHHALLIADVIGVESSLVASPKAPEEDASLLLHNMWESYQESAASSDHRAVVELYHDTVSDLSEVHTLYSFGGLSLVQRAWAEQVHMATCHQIARRLSPKHRAHRDLIDELNEKLADKFFVNFSLFQSMPDAWGIDQVFPVLPLSGLDRAPDRRAVILDITCDSDGAIDQYVDGQGIETTLPMPAYSTDEPYLIGFFMVGAYQEILGDLHNLFGDTDSVDVSIDADGQIAITHPQPGDSVQDVLRYVNLDPGSFLAAYRQLARHLPVEEQSQALEELAAGLEGYTYLEDIEHGG